ncbi:helix-turn-helix domain-containing protein [Sulfitobacter litoralis]|uniref:helix-turn-helix domain-containing protein n=2 Tax=Sulfitobacter litoralis TaxID=335975 RepID=UPI0030ECE32B
MNRSSLLDITDTLIHSMDEVQLDRWDDLSEWASDRVAPVDAVPLEKLQPPKANLYSASLGRIGLMRTSYGTSTQISADELSGAPVVAATNLQGYSVPSLSRSTAHLNKVDDSFLFDLAKTGHSSRLSDDAVQLHLAFDQKLLNEISYSWFGNLPERSTWCPKTPFGGDNTFWNSSLRYIMRLVAETSQPISAQNIRHIEETLCSNLVRSWAAQSGIDISAGKKVVVPRIVRTAEEYIIEYAADAPTLTEIASALDISVRNLTLNFKKFRGCTPGQFIREQRLQATRKALLEADQDQTVSQIAASFSYIHMGEFAKIYRNRFGELPSETLNRSK